MPATLEGTTYVDDSTHGEETEIIIEVVVDGYGATRTEPGSIWVDEVTVTWGDTYEELTRDEYVKHEDAIDAEVEGLMLEGNFEEVW